MSSPRLNYHTLASKTVQTLVSFSRTAGNGLDERVRELVKLRVSQINGCAFCMDMHWADLVRQGMDPRHINAVAGWHEADRFFSERERAALNWAEAVNAVPQRTPTDDEFAQMQRHFSDTEIAELTLAVTAIRCWNMLNASFHMPVPETPYVVAGREAN